MDFKTFVNFFLILIIYEGHLVLCKNCPSVLSYPEFKDKNPESMSFYCSHGHKKINCSEQMPPGSRFYYRCEVYYNNIVVNLNDAPYSNKYLTCESDGSWNSVNDFLHRFNCQIECGKALKVEQQSYIAGGIAAKGSEFPWYAAIYKKDRQKEDYTCICGGTLIQSLGSFGIITAAHCVTYHLKANVAETRDIQDYKIVLGTVFNNFTVNENEPNAQIFNVRNVIVKEEFNILRLDSDIALIQLDRKVQLSDYVRPACFSSLHGLSEQMKGTIAGFGLVEENGKSATELRKVELSTVPKHYCNDGTFKPTVTQKCVGGPDERKKICIGDSGSGMIFYNEILDSHFIKAIVSGGKKGSKCSSYTVFTAVYTYISWIQDQLKLFIEVKFHVATETKPQNPTIITKPPNLTITKKPVPPPIPPNPTPNISKPQKTVPPPIFPGKTECGVSYAETSSSLRWPWMLGIKYKNSQREQFKCTAVLLNENWAITSANCVNWDLEQIFIKFGTSNLKGQDVKSVGVQKVVIHPMFQNPVAPNFTRNEYNVALVKFKRSMIFSYKLLPICFPQMDETIVGNVPSIITTWDLKQGTLNEIESKVFPFTRCQEHFSSKRPYTEVSACTSIAFENGICNTDGGSPMMMLNNSTQRYELAGILSTYDRCSFWALTVFTKTFPILNWIHEHIYS